MRIYNVYQVALSAGAGFFQSQCWAVLWILWVSEQRIKDGGGKAKQDEGQAVRERVKHFYNLTWEA